MSKKDAYNYYLKKNKLRDMEILSLEGRETLKKSEIYKIAACLMDGTSNLDIMEDLVNSKKKTWRKYIDYFPKVFNVELYAESSQEIPLIKALLCIGFILVIEDQVYFSSKTGNKKNPEYITRIKRTINEENEKENEKENKIGKFEELLSYDEKNEMITNLGEIFSVDDYEEFGIKTEVKENEKKIYTYVSDLERFKKNQIKYKMLAEIGPYEDEIFGFASSLRMRTVLEELRHRFLKNIRVSFRINGDIFLDGLENEISTKATQLFEMNNERGHTINDELINIFNEYVDKSFDAFKQKWISESTNFCLDPMKASFDDL